MISFPFSRGKSFFLFTHASSPFPLETSGSFFKFNSFLFIYLSIFLKFNFFIYLFIRSLQLHSIWQYNMSHQLNIYRVLNHHTPSSVMHTKEIFIFFVMQWWYVVPSLKSSPHTHTHTHKYIKRFLILSNCHKFGNTSLLIYPGDNLKFAVRQMYLHTHTYIISLRQPHTITQKYNLHKHTHTHTHTHSQSHSPNILLSVFFNFFQFLQHLSFSAWWLSFIRRHEIGGYRKTYMLLNVYKS